MESVDNNSINRADNEEEFDNFSINPNIIRPQDTFRIVREMSIHPILVETVVHPPEAS